MLQPNWKVMGEDLLQEQLIATISTGESEVCAHTIKIRFCLRKVRVGKNNKKSNTSKQIIFSSCF